ncbi:cupin domain-containing protein [Larkinella terrae]|uniref:Cupin domain-containing protein n=1 Tax=Larkinella terrae TaxID=2025311 RepID=A0A7K0EW22_9BACT|nr:cupin domain-containing protein [Larkinella terrae]MRS65691.1 cupin domain-containing protein [Larkinella terrae]
MNIVYPHTIQNCLGEKLTFLGIETGPEGDKVLVENLVTPQSGPPMHTHFRQDEELTVVSGKLAYQVLGQEPKYAYAGSSVLFKRGVPHRFWNAGEEALICTGWIQPANSIVYYLSAIYAAQNKSGKAQPEAFDAAYLLTRYAHEYDMVEIPPFVRKVIIPITYLIGRLLGKYKHFADAPLPLK